MITINSCQLCDSTQFHQWHTADQWTLVKCNGCGFIFLNPRPPIDHFKSMYDPLSQYSYKVQGEEYITKEKDFIKAYYAQLAHIEKLVKKGRLLEIGSALGFFLEAAKQRGWKPQGVELSKGGTDFCRGKYGIEVFNGDIIDAGFPAQYFDCIVTIHTLEHVYNPAKVIKECARIIRNGGICIVEIPYIKDATRPQDVNNADLPVHLSYFTVETLKRLMESNGFVVIDLQSGENLRMTAQKPPIRNRFSKVNYTTNRLMTRIKTRLSKVLK